MNLSKLNVLVLLLKYCHMILNSTEFGVEMALPKEVRNVLSQLQVKVN